jgi:hypothetical protein
MAITIEDRAHELCELLWVRDAWGLRPVMDDAPPPLADRPAPVADDVRASAPVEAWSEAWPRLWSAVLAHTAQEEDPAAVKRLISLPVGSPDREELIERLSGPSWSDEFGDDAFEPAGHEGLGAWDGRLIERRRAEMRTRPPMHEHDAVDALVPQWRRGLTRIVTIPCVGEHTRTIGPTCLLVTEATRADHARYVQALGRFLPH